MNMNVNAKNLVNININEFARRVKAQRIYMNLSQAEAARKIGVNHATIHRWEYARAMPDSYTLFRVCRAYACSADFLLCLGT